MLKISSHVAIPAHEIGISAIRAQGAGGQNVNKVSSAIHLRFDSQASSLPNFYKHRLLGVRDRRVTGIGIIIIKAQRFRSQEKNREDALARLVGLIRGVAVTPAPRRPTQPSRASKGKRLDNKTRLGRLKKLRQSPD